MAAAPGSVRPAGGTRAEGRRQSRSFNLAFQFQQPVFYMFATVSWNKVGIIY